MKEYQKERCKKCVNCTYEKVKPYRGYTGEKGYYFCKEHGIGIIKIEFINECLVFEEKKKLI